MHASPSWRRHSQPAAACGGRRRTLYKGTSGSTRYVRPRRCMPRTSLAPGHPAACGSFDASRVLPLHLYVLPLGGASLIGGNASFIDAPIFREHQNFLLWRRRGDLVGFSLHLREPIQKEGCAEVSRRTSAVRRASSAGSSCGKRKSHSSSLAWHASHMACVVQHVGQIMGHCVVGHGQL